MRSDSGREADAFRDFARPESALADSGLAGYDRWLKSSTSSVRCRSESPPTVFDWLMRHWLRSRAAFTRPNFGTAMSMSKTFAVDTNSGGSRRIDSMWTTPAFRSRFSCARLTRTSFARCSASILWSSDRAGACACVFELTMSRTSLPRPVAGSSGNVLRNLQGFLCCLNCLRREEASGLADGAPDFARRRESARSELGGELGADPRGRERVSEEHRSEGHGARAGRDELERVTSRDHSAHADDGQVDGS